MAIACIGMTAMEEEETLRPFHIEQAPYSDVAGILYTMNAL